jgi:methylase of polypeptide subunit release factors
MTMYIKKNFKIFENNFSIFLNKSVFEPNLTTTLLIKSVSKIINKNDKVLDLGCGSGIIGCYFYKKKIIKSIYASDLSKAAINCTIYNAKKLTDNYDIRLSDSLNSWQDEKFDLIINDVSGISSKLNDIASWFKFAPNESGKDGIKFTLNILNKYKNNISAKGKLVFPVLGLSNRNKLIKFLKKNKINYKILDKIDWPLPKNLLQHQDLLKKYKKDKIINFNERFGMLFTTTEIFYC